MHIRIFLSIVFFSVSLAAETANGPVAYKGPSTAVFVSTAVLVGFIVRCRRKGLPFRPASKA